MATFERSNPWEIEWNPSKCHPAHIIRFTQKESHYRSWRCSNCQPLEELKMNYLWCTITVTWYIAHAQRLIFGAFLSTVSCGTCRNTLFLSDKLWLKAFTNKLCQWWVLSTFQINVFFFLIFHFFVLQPALHPPLISPSLASLLYNFHLDFLWSVLPLQRWFGLNCILLWHLQFIGQIQQTNIDLRSRRKTRKATTNVLLSSQAAV